VNTAIRARRGAVTRLRPAALALATLLAACTMGPDFQRPEPPKAAGYTPGGAPRISGGAGVDEQNVLLGQALPADWWAPFKSPALDRVLRQALAGNHSLAAAKATLAQAQESVNAASGGLYPQVDLSATAGRQKYGAAFFGPLQGPGPFTYYSIGPSVSYLLDWTGGVRRGIEREQALADYQRYQVGAAYLSLTGNVVTQSLFVASARAQIRTVEAILGDDERNLALVRSAREAGSVTDVDVLSAESQLANDRTLLPPLRQQLSVARHALAVLVGQVPANWAPPDFDLDQFALPRDLPVSLPSALVHDRPDILAAESQLHATSAEIGVATANLYPSIDLTAAFSQQALSVGGLFNASSAAWSFAAGLTAPLFHGGTLSAERRAAADAYQASLEAYKQTVLQSFGQVADVLEALTHDAEQLAAQKHASESAAASLRLTRLSYSAGNVGILQVLDAERLLQQAQLGYVRAQIQRRQDTAQLFLAMGGGALLTAR
jgi:NodT family efflux transporter outer membrane factor (OMF) lipoprotein